MFISTGCISAYVLNICLFAHSLQFTAAPYRALLFRGVNCGAILLRATRWSSVFLDTVLHCQILFGEGRWCQMLFENARLCSLFFALVQRSLVLFRSCCLDGCVVLVGTVACCSALSGAERRRSVFFTSFHICSCLGSAAQWCQVLFCTMQFYVVSFVGLLVWYMEEEFFKQSLYFFRFHEKVGAWIREVLDLCKGLEHCGTGGASPQSRKPFAPQGKRGKVVAGLYMYNQRSFSLVFNWGAQNLRKGYRSKEYVFAFSVSDTASGCFGEHQQLVLKDCWIGFRVLVGFSDRDCRNT